MARSRRFQKGVSMLPAVWEKVYNDYNHLGFKRPSILIETAVIQFLHKKGAIGKRENLDLKKDIKIGQIAKEIGDMHFAAFGLDDFNKAKVAWNKQYKVGWITKEKRDRMIAEEERLKKFSINIQTSRVGRSKIQRESKKESRSDRLEEMRQRVRELNRIPEQKDIVSKYVNDDLLDDTESLSEEEAKNFIERCAKTPTIAENTFLQWRLDQRT